MYKVFLYIMLIISYLGLAKALSPTELGIEYLQNEKGFSKIIKAPHSIAILIDTHATGFLIKTYYQKYRVISGHNTVDEIIVRTSKEFAKRNLKFLGLSIYRRSDSAEDFLPLPPGSHYLGDREFGEWKTTKSGLTRWKFNKTHKNFPQYLGWGKFKPDLNFYQVMRSKISLNQPFYGPHHEFGPDGKVTRENFPHFFRAERKIKKNISSLMMDYLKENF